MRLVSERPDIPAPRNSDLLWAHLALRSVRSGGRVVASLPMSVGTRDSAERVIRGGLVESGALEAWVTLPPDRLKIQLAIGRLDPRPR